MNVRVALANLCDKTGATEWMLGMRRRARSPWFHVLTFHRIAQIGAAYRFDDGVVDATPDELDQHLALLRKYADPIGLDDVARFYDGGRLPNNPVLVTFDDGYRDNCEVALPILKRHGICATFFIATDYVTQRRVFWWDRLSYLVKRSLNDKLRVMYPRAMSLDVATPRARAIAIRDLLKLIKTTFGLDLERFLRELARAAAVPWDEALERRFADELVMSWDQVRALRAAGMSVQSHTRSHRVLQTLPSEDVLGELEGSRTDLERELDESIYAISYPAGHTIEDRADLRRALQTAGYKLGFTNATGAQPVEEANDPYHVNRRPVDLHTSGAVFRAGLAAPSVFL